MLINLCAETIKLVFEVLRGTKSDKLRVEGNASVYHVYPVSRIIGERRADF